MEVAIGNVVTIILGIVTFIGGAMVLNTIMTTTTTQVDQLADSQRQEYLQSFPPRRTLYLPQIRFRLDENQVTIPFGISNPSSNAETYTVNITEVPSSPSETAPTFDHNVLLNQPYELAPGEKKLFLGIIQSTAWPEDQTTFVLELKDSSGTVVMADPFFVG